MNVGSLLSGLAGWRGYALAVTLAFAAGGYATAKVQGAFHSAEVATLKETSATEAAAQARVALAEIVRLSAIISGIDADGMKELNHAIAENESLRADLATGARRLSVRTTSCTGLPGTGGDPRLADGAGRADIDGRDSQALVAITDRGDREIIKLNTLQRVCNAIAERAKAACPVSVNPPQTPE